MNLKTCADGGVERIVSSRKRSLKLRTTMNRTGLSMDKFPEDILMEAYNQYKL